MKNLWHRVLGFADSGRRVVIESVDFDHGDIRVETELPQIALQLSHTHRPLTEELLEPEHPRGMCSERVVGRRVLS